MNQGTSTILMLVLMFAIMYFLMIRPENKRKKKAQEMRDNVQVGDKITTIGGMIGRVVHVSDDKLTFETGEDRVRIEVTKWAISSNNTAEAAAQEEAKKTAEAKAKAKAAKKAAKNADK